MKPTVFIQIIYLKLTVVKLEVITQDIYSGYTSTLKHPSDFASSGSFSLCLFVLKSQPLPNQKLMVGTLSAPFSNVSV